MQTLTHPPSTICACNSVGVEAQIMFTLLGRRLTKKNRPLCVCLDNKAGKILSWSPQLRSNTIWKNVYVNPDLIVTERKNNYKLCQELQERKKLNHSKEQDHDTVCTSKETSMNLSPPKPTTHSLMNMMKQPNRN